jgi:hypothetical protein
MVLENSFDVPACATLAADARELRGRGAGHSLALRALIKRLGSFLRRRF